jgi:hypothetical protein
MMRVLVLIAVTGFLVSLVSLSAAVAIGGPDAIARGAWSMGHHRGWDWDVDDSDHDADEREVTAAGPTTTRELAWTGGDSLEIDLPADVRFTQAPGPGKLVITGPQAAVARVMLEDGRIHFDGRRHGHRHNRGQDRMTIEISAPEINRFELGGANRLTIDGYRQDRLEVDLSGNSELVAKGVAKVVELNISGSGEADLAGLPSEGVDVDISGSGEATVAPSDWATLDVSGSGEVNLLTSPARLETDISGAGRIRQGQPTPPAPAAATPAAPSQKL